MQISWVVRGQLSGSLQAIQSNLNAILFSPHSWNKCSVLESGAKKHSFHGTREDQKKRGKVNKSRELQQVPVESSFQEFWEDCTKDLRKFCWFELQSTAHSFHVEKN